MTISILLADDHQIIREGLRSLIDKQTGMTVIAEAVDGRSTVRLARTHSPDVVIMDVAMPGMNGIEATRQILSSPPSPKIVALSMHADRRFVIGMLKAGALGYLLKDSAFEELSLAVRTVVENRTYLSPRLADSVLKEYIRHYPEHAASAFSLLTEREREVLQLIAEGRTTKQIAVHLTVSVKTVETHRHQIMGKVGVASIAELTKYAIREGLTSLEG